MATGLLVKRLWSHVDPIRPDNGCRLWIDANLCKKGWIAERFENAGPLPRREVHVTDQAIVEQQAEVVWRYHRDPYNSWQIWHSHILWKWSDWLERLQSTGAFPVRQELVSMDTSPFTDEAEGARLEGSGEDGAIHRNRRTLPSMMGMKVRSRMIAFVPVHVDGDPVEGADARHRLRMLTKGASIPRSL